MNTSSITTSSNRNHPFGFLLSAVLLGTIIPLCVIGIIGNVVTMATIIISRKLKSTWYDLILSLTISDLISAVISPIYIHIYAWGFDQWKLPSFFCTLYFGFDYWTSFSTTLHILWFAILRFISIRWPHSFNNVLARYTKTSIILIWFVTFLTSFVPSMWIRAETRNRSDLFITSQWPACSATEDLFNFYKIYTLFASVLFVYIPCILVVVVSIAIGIRIFTMRKERRNKQGDRRNEDAEKKRTRKENQLLLQLGLIVGSFMIGYFPLTGLTFYYLFPSFLGPGTEMIFLWFKQFQVILLRLSECLNPIFYNLASSKMRKETLLVLRQFRSKICCKANPPPNANRVLEKKDPSKDATNRTNVACSRV